MRRKITIYPNLEAQKADEIQDVLDMSPEERIATVVALIRQIYDVDNIPPSPKRITILSNDLAP